MQFESKCAVFQILLDKIHLYFCDPFPLILHLLSLDSAVVYLSVVLHFLNLCTNKSIELIGPRQANLVLIAYASSEGSGEPAHPRSLARTFATRSYRQ